ncbi:hypothetical protein GCM10023091_35880 [Ravibacter arvi]|uniref:histidine kinase n=1 Tax=Ravibacter arvi TaxID=2051041 RepID=A0ABP8M7Y7_9BACT
MFQHQQTIRQLGISVLAVIISSVLAWLSKAHLDNMAVGLLLMLVVSTLAVVFDIFPVLVAAFLSALILNFFFVEPLFTYKIHDTESALLFSIYISIAVVHAVLTNRVRKQAKKSRDREEKEKTIRLYNTLLNSLSHELKTPIATIIGAIDTLKDAGIPIPAPQQNELLNEMETAANRLSYQVENLLNMSRVESGNFRLKTDWIDVNEMIFSCIRKIPAQHLKRFIFKPDDKLPLLKLDEGLIETALYSILHNAARYTPEQATVMIDARYEDGFLAITISDNGTGIPEQHLHHIFEKFYRLPHSGTGGTGLGLSIAKGFVEAHEGKISVRNLKAGGAQFEITLPADVSYLNSLKNE